MSTPGSVFGRNELPVDPRTEQTRLTRHLVIASDFELPAQTGANDHHLEDIHAPGSDGGSGILFFRIAHTGSPTISVRMNSSHLIEHIFDAHSPGTSCWHAVIPAGTIEPLANELVFAINEDGTAKISDVAILYTSDQLTVLAR